MLSQSDKPLGHLYRSSAVDCQKLSVATKFKVKCLDYLSRTEGATGTKSGEARIWAVHSVPRPESKPLIEDLYPNQIQVTGPITIPEFKFTTLPELRSELRAQTRMDTKQVLNACMVR